MKKISIAIFSVMLFTACENTGSSTVGTYEKDEETTQSPDQKEEAQKEQSTRQNTGSTTSDTLQLPVEGRAADTTGTTSPDSAHMKMSSKP